MVKCFLRPKIIDIPSFTDERGDLCFFETANVVDFSIKRVYYMTNAKGVKRGGHAHKDLRQLFVAVGGSVDITLDDGSNSYNFVLSDPTKSLYVPAGYWRDIDFENSGVSCFVFASEVYDEDDYIRDYDDFKKWSLGNKKG